jgi:glutamate synthase domain-containing protein 3
MAGERFAVRNSGVKAVVEGVGDHGCEYMTGGIVVNLGDWGRNFAAGMSGGVAFLFDPEANFVESCNLEMVEIEEPSLEDLEETRRLIRNHFRYTSSEVALEILNNWEERSGHFVKVMPKDYKAVLQRLASEAKTKVKAAKVQGG